MNKSAISAMPATKATSAKNPKRSTQPDANYGATGIGMAGPFKRIADSGIDTALQSPRWCKYKHHTYRKPRIDAGQMQPFL